MKKVKVSVEFGTGVLRKLERLAKINVSKPNSSVGELLARYARDLVVEERRSVKINACVANEARTGDYMESMSFFWFTKAQMLRLQAVSRAVDRPLARVVAAFALGLLDQADPHMGGAHENLSMFKRHLNRFDSRRLTPTRPALPKVVSSPFPATRKAKTRLGIGRNTLRRITAVAKAQGMTPKAWIKDRLKKVAKGTPPATAQAPQKEAA